ncbi:MAG: hypothetical protein ACI4PE_03380 [Bacilli bacterium]
MYNFNQIEETKNLIDIHKYAGYYDGGEYIIEIDKSEAEKIIRNFFKSDKVIIRDN